MEGLWSRALVALALSLVLVGPAPAFDAFTVDDIEVRGANRISVGTVLNYLPVRTGERFGPEDARRAVRALYETGLFADVSVSRAGQSLVVTVQERPAIGIIEIEGDFSMEEEQLRESLRQIGLARGRVFNRSVLDQVEQELRRQLYSRGKYAMELETEVEDLERNRVAVTLTIREGKTARIRQIRIIGNDSFSDATLLELMDSAESDDTGWLSSADEYSRTTLEGDLEAVRSHYLDRGYINFSLTSSPVTITPDKKDIYVTINVDEGAQYRVGDVALEGDFPVARETLREELQIASGDLFSRKSVTASREAISSRLARSGYAFARINVAPEVNEEERIVDLRFFVDPGRRVYVRRITFSGHTATEDHVYRREMRQLEGGLYSPDNVDRSRVRLQRLPQVQQVRMETQRVSGRPDLVDVNYQITERRTGSLSLGAGYSTSQGVVFNASVRQQNVLGTGKSLSFSVDNSESQRRFVIRYTNPYYTQWGVSRSLRLTYRETDPNDILDTADFFSDTGSVGVEYGIPISEYDTLDFGIGVEGTRIRTTGSTPQPILDFLDANGTEYGFLEGNVAWTRDTRNRTIFAERGWLSRLSADAALPGSDLQYYKVDHRFEAYTPFTDYLVGSASTHVAVGEGYGDQEDLPFFRRFYAGGIRSVRGYAGASLGPRYPDGDARGGDLLTTGSLELIFPPPFAPESGQTRLSLFYDFGNVYESAEDFEANALRSAVGISLNWRSPVGPLSFSIAEAIDPEPGDDTQRFQFTIGTLF
jgi:outer membrane protein insertion porin family